MFSVKYVIFPHSTFCLLLLEQTLAGINSDSQEAAWLICFALSTDFSPQLWAQIKLPCCLCAWIRHRSLLANPGEYQNQSKNPVLRRKLLRYVLIKLMSLKDPPPCLKPGTLWEFTSECNTAPRLPAGSWLAHQCWGLGRGCETE